MNITIVGAGYVGLVTGACLADTGNYVTCVDIDLKKIELLKEGLVPIYEPGLQVLVERNLRNGNLNFTDSLPGAVQFSEVVFLALPTPPNEDGSADLSHVMKVSEDLSELIDRYTVIVTKSTVPVGTGDEIHKRLSRKLDSKMFDVVSNPEFLREGSAVGDFMKPDRVVVGTSTVKAQALMTQIYEPYVRQNNPILYMDIRSAEMTKYAANCYLATRISFMNEVANLCDKIGANVDNVRKGIGSDSRIGKAFLYPGIGYGGSCFPKDVKAMERTARTYGYDFKILNASEEVNGIQRRKFFENILEHFHGDIKGKTVALWGLAFKPNTDDIREAPALDIIQGLLDAGALVKVFDPEAMDNVRAIFDDALIYSDNQYDAIEDADVLVIATEWNLFRTPDFGRMKQIMSNPVIFDGRNLYSPTAMAKSGFWYSSIGRPLESKLVTNAFHLKIRKTG